jgi:hypothetical protein
MNNKNFKLHHTQIRKIDKGIGTQTSQAERRSIVLKCLNIGLSSEKTALAAGVCVKTVYNTKKNSLKVVWRLHFMRHHGPEDPLKSTSVLDVRSPHMCALNHLMPLLVGLLI